MPKTTFENEEDFRYALDYLAFYGIDEKVTFEISANYAESFFNVYQEFLRVHKMTEIADIFPIDLDRSRYDTEKTIALQLFYNESFATIEPEKEENVVFVHSFDYENDLSERGDSFVDFPLKKENRGRVAVTNTQQLFYALENRYYPLCEEGSTSFLVFEEIQNVLRRIIDNGMDEREKCRQIYAYLTSEILYDSKASATSSYENTRMMAYYLEGVFLHKKAVCDGKAKAFVALCAMEGIKAKRVTDFDDDLSGHSYNYVRIDDTWYLCCTTYGATRMEREETNYVLPSYDMFLTTKETPYSWGYDSTMFPEIGDSISTVPYDYCRENGLTFDTIEELLLFLNEMEKEKDLDNIKFEFLLEKDDIQDLFPALEENFPERDYDIFSERGVQENWYSLVFYGGEI